MNAKNNPVPAVQNEIAPSFDLVRLSRSKEFCDFCPNTIRKFFSEGLRAYRLGKMVMFSRSELAAFIKTRAQ
jgi:hypothetical protein